MLMLCHRYPLPRYWLYISSYFEPQRKYQDCQKSLLQNSLCGRNLIWVHYVVAFTNMSTGWKACATGEFPAILQESLLAITIRVFASFMMTEKNGFKMAFSPFKRPQKSLKMAGRGLVVRENPAHVPGYCRGALAIYPV
jgi:hypothetical protein